MNISEAFKHLLAGKKIKHKSDGEYIFWLLGEKIARYQKTKDCYTLFLTEFAVNDSRINHWMVIDEPLNIRFDSYGVTVPALINKGYTLKRLKTGKRYNKYDLSENGFTIEDMEASDWVVEDQKRTET